ncbi:MAG: hypothetical protein GKS03_12805 [Alphaproteobacteria bacterium]|nr:hypothetical protein [Alphaproteobacteria bacterium]
MTYSESKGFQTTYEIITEESVQHGDFAECGWLDWRGESVDNPWESHWDVQDLLRLKGYRFEGDGSTVPRWITADADMTDTIHPAGVWSFLGNEDQPLGGSISIHRPDWITDSSWIRVCRLLCYSI